VCWVVFGVAAAGVDGGVSPTQGGGVCGGGGKVGKRAPCLVWGAMLGDWMFMAPW